MVHSCISPHSRLFIIISLVIYLEYFPGELHVGRAPVHLSTAHDKTKCKIQDIKNVSKDYIIAVILTNKSSKRRISFCLSVSRGGTSSFLNLLNSPSALCNQQNSSLAYSFYILTTFISLYDQNSQNANHIQNGKE